MSKSAHSHSTSRARLWSFKPILLAVLCLVLAIPFLLLIGRLIEIGQNGVLLPADQLQLQSSNLGKIVQSVQVVESTPKPVTITDLGKPAPKFGSVAVLAMDYDTGKVLYDKNIHLRRSPASTTKLMTALVSVKHYQLGQVLTVMPEDTVQGSSMGLHAGETVTYRGLLYGMLLNSGNDAAFTIASNYPGGLIAFVGLMNKQVRDLGLIDTSFTNPAGFDGPGHYSSAYDLAVIAKAAVENNQIARIVGTKNTSVLAMDRSQEHELHNLNQLLGEPGVLGIKTGTTEQSGENFVGLVERNGRKIITVVLGSSDRFTESRNLINWVYDNFVWSY